MDIRTTGTLAGLDPYLGPACKDLTNKDHILKLVDNHWMTLMFSH